MRNALLVTLAFGTVIAATGCAMETGSDPADTRGDGEDRSATTTQEEQLDETAQPETAPGTDEAQGPARGDEGNQDLGKTQDPLWGGGWWGGGWRGGFVGGGWRGGWWGGGWRGGFVGGGWWGGGWGGWGGGWWGGGWRGGWARVW